MTSTAVRELILLGLIVASWKVSVPAVMGSVLGTWALLVVASFVPKLARP